MKRSPIRRTPVRKVRPGTRRGQPTRNEKACIRLAAYERAGGLCELRISHLCILGVLPFIGSAMERWHLVHLHAKRRFGWGEDNLCGGCYWCHAASHNAGGKPCPAKPREEPDATTR